MSHFFDSNIFIYAVSKHPDDAPKRQIARQLIEENDPHLSLQVVQEFIHVCLRKARLGQAPNAVRATAEFLLTFPCLVPSRELVLQAMTIQTAFQLSYWDAAILAAAKELRCAILYTEDLSHGQDYEGVRVVNPFL